MMEVLHFIFSSFWVWLGTVILVSAFTNAFATFWSALVVGLSSRR